ncbi:MAG: hydantoinase/oxoprolinase family protein [Xanthobacteraceae bacterium]|nr:MAG: hydantoinase/oxoprolinase family protein [Xanthobacteraceae bacterium]
MNQRTYRIAVDVGGTFTDATLCEPGSGKLISAKALTTPRDRADGVLDAIRAVLEAGGVSPDQVVEVVHGSTAGTNALIERNGARVGLLTTEGFRDVLEIGRIMRPEAGLYDFSVDLPLPLVPRHLRLEARERIAADGSVLIPLDESSVEAVAEHFAREKVEAVAICFLFSFLNPTHEEKAAEILARKLPGVPISLSAHVSPEIREYERSSTTVMNAYLTPIMNAYLDKLQPRLRDYLGPIRLSIIQANGGSTTVDLARSNAVTTVNSGPAGGVVAAAFYGRNNDRDRIVSVDMGGTSFDIGLIENGISKVTTEGAFQGLPVKIPIIDLHIIGAGGGSIAWRDPGGALNVGPYSAAAMPGPACYGRGGDKPTVTDANVVLGRLNPDNFNAGRMQLDADAARRAVASLARQLGLGLEQTALGIIKIVNANMVKGIAAVTILRGIDVRDFSLVSFGGAGGVHAVDLARDLGMAEAVIPPLPGTFSAVGLLVTDMRHDYVTALGGLPVDKADIAALESHFQDMEKKGRDALTAQGFAAKDIELVRLADLKVTGQTYELSLPLPVHGRLDKAGLDQLIASFAALYRECYAFFFEGEPIELVNLRVSALGHNAPVALPHPAAAGPDPSMAGTGQRAVYFEETGFTTTAVYDRALLKPGMIVSGPAVIEETTSSTLIPPGTQAMVAADLGLFVPLGRPLSDPLVTSAMGAAS